LEANEERRTEYLKQIENISADKLVYIDETGIELASCKDRGWGKKNQLLVGKKSGKYYERTNIVAGYTNKKALAPLVFNGSCNTNLFETWVEKCLVKELVPGQFVILDNATFHKSQKIKDLIESAECYLIFLPPYSPDLNPIEKFWANMKRWIKEKIDSANNLYETIQSFFCLC
jgi:transposase